MTKKAKLEGGNSIALVRSESSTSANNNNYRKESLLLQRGLSGPVSQTSALRNKLDPKG